MMTDQSKTPPSTPSSPVPTRSWLSLHRWGIIWTALFAVIILVQWPMLIALSGYGAETDVRESLNAGFREHLVKPVDLQGLNDALIRAVSEGKHSTRQCAR